MVILHAGERLFDHLLGVGIAWLLFARDPFPRLARTEPLQRRVGIWREIVGVGGVDRLWIACMLEDPGALHAASDCAGIERAFDPGIGMFLAGHDCLGEFFVRVAPAIDGADADVEMLGEFLVCGAEAAHFAGYGCEFGFVDHGAVDSAGGAGVESRRRWQNVSRVLTILRGVGLIKYYYKTMVYVGTLIYCYSVPKIADALSTPVRPERRSAPPERLRMSFAVIERSLIHCHHLLSTTQ